MGGEDIRAKPEYSFLYIQVRAISLNDHERFSSPWACGVTFTYNEVAEKCRFSSNTVQKYNIAIDPEQFRWQLF